MKIILTNDDGIDAPGLETLTQVVSSSAAVTVVAPGAVNSGVGHRVTCHYPIVVEPRSNSRYSVMGTPADCARLAIKVFAPDADWLVAGINAGANLGSDVYQSGTVAAAREAAILGIKAIAISQYIARDHQIDWDITRRHAETVIKQLLATELDAGTFWNVNLPHPLSHDVSPPSAFCELDTNPHHYAYRRDGNTYHYEGSIHERPREPDRDVAVCFGGRVAITRLSV